MPKTRSEAAQSAWDAWKAAQKATKAARLGYMRGKPRIAVVAAVDTEQHAKQAYDEVIRKESIAKAAPKHNANVLAWLAGIAKRDPRHAGLIVAGRRIMATDGKILAGLMLRDGVDHPLPGPDGWRSLKAPYNPPVEEPADWRKVVSLLGREQNRKRRAGAAPIGFNPAYLADLTGFKSVDGHPITWALHPSEDGRRTTLWTASFTEEESPIFARGVALICPRCI